MSERKQREQGSSLALATWVAQILDRKGGLNIKVIETSSGSAIADYIVLATGTSSRHLDTLLEAPVKELKSAGFPPLSIEGEGTHWLLADLGDVILHIFDEETRAYFDLDGLWSRAPQVKWEPQMRLSPTPASV